MCGATFKWIMVTRISGKTGFLQNCAAVNNLFENCAHSTLLGFFSAAYGLDLSVLMDSPAAPIRLDSYQAEVELWRTWQI